MRKIKREAFEAMPAERKPSAKMQPVACETQLMLWQKVMQIHRPSQAA